MVEPLTQLQTTLKTHRQSLTSARKVIFDVLQGQEPQTMHEIIAACGGQVDRASVYRTIALYEQLGIVRRLQIGWKYKLELSDQFQHHHHHLTCLNCGRVVPLPEDEQLESRLHLLAKNQHFLIKDHLLEIQGLCPECQQSLRSM